MKKILIILNVFILLLATTSCEDWLDVNEDPNNAAEATLELVFPAAQASITTVMSGELYNVGGFWSQLWDQNPTANQYNGLSTYNVTTGIGDNPWMEFYSGGLNDLQYVIEEAEANEDWGNYLAAVSMRAYMYQVLVDLFDQVPYTEALQGTEVLNPTFDEGSDVYEGILDELDEALGKDLAGASVVSSDLFFDGQINTWVAFARTVKLKMLLRMSETSDPHTTELTTLLNGGNFLTVPAGIASNKYDPKNQNKRNPWYETNVSRLSGDGQYSINHVGCYNFISYLQSKSDPRIDYLFYPSQNSGTHEGNWFGSSKSNPRFESQDDFSTVKMAADHPSYIMLGSESLLLQAEAHARIGSDLTAVVKPLYDQAVAVSFEELGVEAGAASYTSAGGSMEFTATTLDEAIEQIIMQKWVCLAHFNPLESWFEQSRTGYPNISNVPADDAAYVLGEWTSPLDNLLGDGNFPHRFYFPDAEVTSNNNTPSQIPNVSVKVWWDQN